MKALKGRKFTLVDSYGLSELRKAFEEKGWVVKRDKETIMFDFKVSHKFPTKDHQQGYLLSSQIVNHF